MEVINCIDCNEIFEFSESDKRFFEEKGYSKPKRCKPCRTKKKAFFEKRESDKYYKQDWNR